MKKRQYYDLAIIGGGITGLAIAYKSSLLGLKVVLIEKEEIGHGASGHFHEFLHSGVRYAVVDPDGAKECYEENQRLQRPQSLVRDAIYQTGGFFIALTESDVEYFEILVTACQGIGIPVVEVPIIQVIREIPKINKNIKRALYVPDGHINGKRVLEIYKKEAEENGVYIITYQQVIGINKLNGCVDSVIIQDVHGVTSELVCNFVINAAGIWAGQVSKLVNIEIPLIPSRGAMLVFKEKFSEYAFNRCHAPFDGDIWVASRDHTILGTTSKNTKDLDDFTVKKEELEILLHEGKQLIPSLSKMSIIKEYAGVRPLYTNVGDSSDGRGISRSFKVINHNENGISNFISVVGGKFMLFERMADKAVEVMKQNLLLSKMSSIGV